MKKIKLLITGSAGFIMGNYIRRLVYLCRKDPEQYNYIISSVDNVRSGGLNAIYNNKGHNFHIADLTNKHILDVIFKLEKPDIVIHGATISDESCSLNELLNNNVVGTQNLIDLCIKYKVKRTILLKKFDNNFVYTSNVDKSQKMACDLFATAHVKQGLNFNILQIPKVFGPRQSENNFIPKIIKHALNKENIIINEGSNDWVHVFDVCSALNNILKQNNKDSLNFQYGIFSYERYNNLKLTTKIFNILEADQSLISQSQNFYTDKNYNVPYYDGHGVNLEDIGWGREFNNFDQLLQDTVNWYLKNNWFFNNDR